MSVILYLQHTFFLFPKMLICPSKIFTSINIMYLFQVFTLKRCFYFEISRNRTVVQTPITNFINSKEKHVSIRRNSILTLMKSGAPFFFTDIIYMIYLDVKFFSVVFLSIYYEKFTVKTTLTTMGHFFTKKLNFCPSYIVLNSNALKCQCFKLTSKFLIYVFLYIQQVVI